MKKVDTIIVGQGIAGSILAFRCIERGEKIMVIDPRLSSASTIAFGLINPITGRKYVKSWMVETLIAETKTTYQDLERFFGMPFLEEIDIVRAFNDGQEEEFWMLRSGDEGYENYLSNDQSQDIDLVFKKNVPHGIVKGCYQAQLGAVVQNVQNWLMDQQSFLEAKFDYDKLSEADSHWQYQDILADKIIFCEGAGLIDNPFFQGLPVLLNKGDILVLEVPSYPKGLIVKNKYFTIPLEDHKIWFGVVNSWTDLDPNPNVDAKNALISEWEKRYALKMNLIEHLTAFRLAVKDRRPLLGAHAQHENMYIFSGMGTKGGSLVPYFSKMLLGWISGDCELSDQVNINRFNQ